ncbi:hypothetical protein N9L06_05705 [Mariniblastus sp.]|nr:hypothetical protein [Mariniblastus sp.]
MRKQLTFLLALPAALLLPSLSIAQSTFDGGPDGTGTDWETAANWDGDVLPAGEQPGGNPNIGEFAVTLTSDQSVGELDLVGDQTSGTGILNHSAGTLTSAGNWLKVGGAGNDGTYNLSGSAVYDGIGFDGPTLAFIGFAGGTGTLNLSDSASLSAPGETGLRLAAEQDGSTGILTISDTASVNVGSFNSGGGAGATATVNQTGGTLTSNTWVVLGNFGANGTATYNISGGTVSATGGNLAVGQEGTGTLNVSGTAVVEQAIVDTSAIFVGGIDDNGFIQDGTGTLNITGSTASVSGVGVGLRVASTAVSAGTLSWTADAGGVTPIVSGGDTLFGPGTSTLVLDLSADSASATAGTEYLLVDNSAAVTGTFTDLPEGALIRVVGTGIPPDGNCSISYVGGTDGFDIVATVVGGGAVLGDFSGDGIVDCDDIDLFAGTFGSVAEGSPASRDLTGDGTVDMADALELIQMLVVTSPNGRTGTFVGDLNCDGSVDVLGDAFILVANLGTSSGAVYTDGDLNFDGAVTVLGDAFAFVANLNSTNES